MPPVTSDLFQSVVPFVETAQRGSFTAAANALGVTVSAVSKAVRELEAELGVALLVRTSRSVKLTPEGSNYLKRASEAILSLRAAREELLRNKKQPSGAVRVTLSNVIGPYLVPHLPNFRARYPKVVLQLNLTERAVRLVEEQMDVAIRVGAPRDSNLVMRRLAEPRWSLVASPSYLAKRGIPRTTDELATYDGVHFMNQSGIPRAFTLRDSEGKPREIPIPPTLLLDNGQLLVDAALAGLGVVQVFDFMVSAPLQSGSLIELFPELAPPGPPIVALTPAARAKVPAVAALLDYLTQLYRAKPSGPQHHLQAGS